MQRNSAGGNTELYSHVQHYRWEVYFLVTRGTFTVTSAPPMPPNARGAENPTAHASAMDENCFHRIDAPLDVEHRRCLGGAEFTTHAGIASGVLVVAAAERILFKATVDMLEQYRYLAGQLILLSSVVTAVLGMCAKCRDNSTSLQGQGHLSKWCILLIAILDGSTFFMLLIAGGLVPAAMTVTLHQLTVPVDMLLACICARCNACCPGGEGGEGAGASVTGRMSHVVEASAARTQLQRRQGPTGCSRGQRIGGAALVALGAAIHVSAYALDAYGSSGGLSVRQRTELYNCLLYAAAAIPAACSTIFKEVCLPAPPPTSHARGPSLR